MRHPTLQTERLTLRGLLLSDAPVVKRLAGDREIAYNTLLIPHPYEEGFAERWIAERQVEFQKNGALTFAMLVAKSNAFCGVIGLAVSQVHSHGELGYWVGVPHWNQGYCSEAAAAVVHYGFEVLSLNRIWAAHFSRNRASGRVLQKLGMTHEGCLREHISKWGQYQNVEQYGMLRSEWLENRKVKRG